MRTVDQSYMQISYVQCVRKLVKWYKTFFFHLLDIAVFSSYVLHAQKTSQNTQFCDFCLHLICQIVDMYGKPKVSRDRLSGGDNPLRLVGRHFSTLMPLTSTEQDLRKQCVVRANTTMRAKRRAEFRYKCADRNFGLYKSGCFRDYHTLKYF